MLLKKIVANSLAEVETQKMLVPPNEMKQRALSQPPPLDFKQALMGEGISLIAEVKKASPSRGVIKENFDPVATAKSYAASGAAAISVLTESGYFQGSLDYLAEIKETLGDRISLLRKDFILDPYQVYQARAYGADALLLIVSLLTIQELHECLNLSEELGMACLVEVHKENEVAKALEVGASIIGINNRNLDTFEVDIETTGRLRPLIPSGKIVVAESGINGTADMKKMHRWGVDAVLVGEWLMKSDDVVAGVRELLK
jgi:indole-3-glycerol phosphate synthase